MRKRTLCLSMAIVMAAAYGMYEVKWKVYDLREKNLLTEAEIIKERRALEVLSAEWAYLTRPDRLENLAHKHLPELIPSNGTQLAEIEEFPPQPIIAQSDGSGLKYSSYSAPR